METAYSAAGGFKVPGSALPETFNFKRRTRANNNIYIVDPLQLH